MQKLPDALIVFLASTEYEAVELSKAGVPAVVCNVSIFVDEKVFRPLAPMNLWDAEFDAIYNARLEPYKRHALASDVNKLALIWDRRFDGTSSPYDQEVISTLSNANHLNIEKSSGKYKSFALQEVAHELARAKCGLLIGGGGRHACIDRILALRVTDRNDQ